MRPPVFVLVTELYLTLYIQCNTLNPTTFEWDEEKNLSNFHKHGVWFEEAQTVFYDCNARVFFDQDHSSSEDRFLIIGCSSAARILIVVHCYRSAEKEIRIISARKATKKERRDYEERV